MICKTIIVTILTYFALMDMTVWHYQQRVNTGEFDNMWSTWAKHMAIVIRVVHWLLWQVTWPYRIHNQSLHMVNTHYGSPHHCLLLCTLLFCTHCLCICSLRGVSETETQVPWNRFGWPPRSSTFVKEFPRKQFLKLTFLSQDFRFTSCLKS